MRVLFVCEEMPSVHPRWANGMSLISYELITRLPPQVQIDCAYFALTEEPLPDAVRSRCRHLIELERRPRPPSPLQLATSRYGGAMWRATSPSARAAVAAAGREVDLTVIQGPQALGLTFAAPGPVVVQEIDPWSSYLADEAAAAQGPSRWTGRLNAARMRRVEQRAGARAAGYVLVNPDEVPAMENVLGRKVIAIPNGWSEPERLLPAGPGALRVGFLGGLSHPPNVAAARELVGLLAGASVGGAPVHVTLAGRRPSEQVLALAGANVSVVADFASLTELLAELDVLAFPAQQGRGARNSVSDGLAHGVPVVAHASAARGQVGVPHLMVVDDGRALVDAVLRLLDPAVNREVRGAGLATAAARSWDAVARRYLEVYREAVAAAR